MTKLLVEPDHGCWEYQNQTRRDLDSKRVQCDEIRSFANSEEKKLPDSKRNKFCVGDVWTWTAMDADSKLMICWQVGERSARRVSDLISELQDWLANRVQPTTDGMNIYATAVQDVLGSDIDYVMLAKFYGPEPEEKRYGPSVCLAAERIQVQGLPRLKAYLHQLHRAPEPDGSHGPAAVHSAD